jgi:hypothetical protein
VCYNLCKSRDSDCDEYNLPGCYTVLFGESYAFRRKTSPQSSGSTRKRSSHLTEKSFKISSACQKTVLQCLSFRALAHDLPSCNVLILDNSFVCKQTLLNFRAFTTVTELYYTQIIVDRLPSTLAPRPTMNYGASISLALQHVFTLKDTELDVMTVTRLLEISTRVIVHVPLAYHSLLFHLHLGHFFLTRSSFTAHLTS